MSTIVEVPLKHCGRCDTSKPETDFGWTSKAKERRNPWCRACHSEYQRKRKWWEVKAKSEPYYEFRHFRCTCDSDWMLHRRRTGAKEWVCVECGAGRSDTPHVAG